MLRYPQLSASWLLTGEGSMLVDSHTSEPLVSYNQLPYNASSIGEKVGEHKRNGNDFITIGIALDLCRLKKFTLLYF